MLMYEHCFLQAVSRFLLSYVPSEDPLQSLSFAVAGASDDIRRATELAYRAVSEFGLSSVVGPLAVSSMGGAEDAMTLRDSGVFSVTVHHGFKFNCIAVCCCSLEILQTPSCCGRLSGAQSFLSLWST